MTPRTIVAIEPGFDESLLVKLAKAPIAIPGAEVWNPFRCDPDAMPPWTQAGAVQAHGVTLREKLSGHQGVASALLNVLSTPPASRHPVYFQVRAGEAERLRWETLWDDNEEFLALDPRWPIARIADSEIDFQLPVQVFTPPLRILAVMSALGLPAKPEWEKLYAAVDNARQQGLAVELSVLVGEEDLLAAIRKDVQDKTVTGVRIDAIQNSVEIGTALDNFKPHILHFFCHGSANFGKPQLELATIADRELGTSSVVLGIKQLTGAAALRDVWLVTLNCCEGGKAASDLHSMAHRLVAAGVPAAVGMLEPIDAGDAHAFCGAFYTAALRMVRQFLQDTPEGKTGEIEWAEALHPPRSLLSGSAPGPVSRPEWTLPVLYVRPERFQVKREAPAAALPPQVLKIMQDQATAAAMILRGLPPDTSLALRDQILATLANIPPELRPDRNGNLPGGA